MRLHEELKLKREYDNHDNEALLNIVVTTSRLFNFSDRFFSNYGVTTTQYNIIKTLEGFDEEGLSQQDLSEKLVVSKSNMVGLIDRLEKAGYVSRDKHPTDRRQHVLHLTKKSHDLIKRVDKVYFSKIEDLMKGISFEKKRVLIGCLEIIRVNISDADKHGGVAK